MISKRVMQERNSISLICPRERRLSILKVIKTIQSLGKLIMRKLYPPNPPIDLVMLLSIQTKIANLRRNIKNYSRKSQRRRSKKGLTKI